MLESFRKNRMGILLMFISSIAACLGQLFWKLSVNGAILYLLCGFFLYGIGAMIMIIAYRYGSLSVLQPMLSINYIFSLIIGALILHESVTILKLVGILFIILGAFLIGGGDN